MTFILVFLIALAIPVVQESASAKIGVYIALTVSIGFFFYSASSNAAVVVLDKDSLVIRGVKPGIWKLFQLWHVTRVADQDIVSIKLGYLREELGSRFNYTPGEPSRNAAFQVFLWITYREDGVDKDIYYPHIKNIKGFEDLATLLEARYGQKVQKNYDLKANMIPSDYLSRPTN